MTIIGTGADELTVDAGGNARIFEIDDATVKLSGLTLTGGDADTGLGGAIHADGVDLTLHQVAITSNTADRAGGMHLSDGHLAVVDSTFSGNTATQHAGALDVRNVSEAILTQCTFSGNDAGSGYGGAILLSSTVGHASLTQCTVTANEADSHGGGVYAAASNTTVYLQNTIVADNHTSGDNRDDISGAVGSDSSYNLIGTGEGLSGISDGSQGNQIGTSGSPLDPELAPLADNGGPTQTHAPRVGSPVIFHHAAGRRAMRAADVFHLAFAHRAVPGARSIGRRLVGVLHLLMVNLHRRHAQLLPDPGQVFRAHMIAPKAIASFVM